MDNLAKNVNKYPGHGECGKVSITKSSGMSTIQELLVNGKDCQDFEYMPIYSMYIQQHGIV